MIKKKLPDPVIHHQSSIINLQNTLDRSIDLARPFTREGRLADYIPALTKANPGHLGVAVATVDGQVFSAGDSEIPFTIQSVSKIFSLAYVLKTAGLHRVTEKVGMEPSGNPFYSLVQLEYESGKPRNPFINAGAIAITSMIGGETGLEKSSKLIGFFNALIPGVRIGISDDVYRSEYDTSHRNRALGHFMKHFGIIEGSVLESVDAYFRQCAIGMNCKQLTQAGLFLANGGKTIQNETIISSGDTRLINALMTMSGLYDASGEFAVRVGLPAKSGVGGGILAIAPGKMAIAVFGPALDEKSNSIGGIKILEFLSRELNLSLFG